MTAVGTVVAIGERLRVQGWCLAGVVVLAAEDAAAVQRSWEELDDGVAVVILTPTAVEALGEQLDGRASPLVVVLPP
ncbi:hypothetical protein [Saccharopolyspora sp. NPDC002686]|uniref:hypothetical protein n=1 Tax=Saccharopolyspora sp. NPDC002686 TaxID=3154541 RepID=UPI00332B146E